MKYNKIFLVIGLFLLGSFAHTQSYLKQNSDSEILSKILKEIEELKKGQEKLSNEIKGLKSAQSSNKKQPPPSGDQSASIKDVPVGNSMVLGNPEAPITIIKWTDFQ